MTPKAQVAYQIYRDLGPARTLSQVAQLQGRSGNTQLERWSAKYEWVRLCAEHDHAELRGALGQRSIVRERALQRLVDSMDQAVVVLLDIMADNSQVPVLDRQGEQMTDDEGNGLYRYQVRASTRAQCAEKVLALGGLVPTKRTVVMDRTCEELDEAASVLESMHPDDLDEFMAIVQRRNRARDD